MSSATIGFIVTSVILFLALVIISLILKRNNRTIEQLRQSSDMRRSMDIHVPVSMETTMGIDSPISMDEPMSTDLSIGSGSCRM